MAEVPPQIPGWMEEIFDYLEEKPYRYSPLIDGHFGLRGSEENPGDGFGFSLGFLFSAVVSPEQMELNLTKYRIVKNTAESEALDLIGTITEGTEKRVKRVVAYRENLPLDTLAIGYFERRPTIDVI